MRGGHEPGRASLLASRAMVDETAARREPRPTEPRFMESVLFLADVLTAHEPESAGKPDALQTLRAERTGFRNREAFGVRGFTPAFRIRFMESGCRNPALRARRQHGQHVRQQTAVLP